MTKRKGPYLKQLHLELVLLLGAICVVLGLVGWWLRPQSTGFPDVPEGLGFNLVSSSTWSSVAETLYHTQEGGSLLELGVDSVSSRGQGPWTMTVQGLGSGRLCSQGQRLVQTVQQFANDKGQTFTVRIAAVRGRGPVDLSFCWGPGSGGPVALDGSYLSARFPDVEVPGSPTAQRQLFPEGDTADFVIQSQPPPTSESDVAWSWDGDNSPDDDQLVAAVNLSDSQRDAYGGFISGVAFGIAGAALIGLGTELLVPSSRRRDLRYENGEAAPSPPSTSGGHDEDDGPSR